ncbi:hypothetical protein L7F22_058611 [Adiantum nelumboides]|nr:hypothetical protein [Adiantum nelumboides]
MLRWFLSLGRDAMDGVRPHCDGGDRVEVLSLAWSMAKLGWVAGPLVLLVFAFITYFTSLLLANCYRSSDGKRNYTYTGAVRSILGEGHTKFCAIPQYGNFVGIAIGYTITASISLMAITKSTCYRLEGEHANCDSSTKRYMIIFGVIQVILSQIPSFSKLWWLSIVAAFMSFLYSSISIALGISKYLDRSQSHVTKGMHTSESLSKSSFWLVFQAMGNIAFAYSYSMILVEIQDTIASIPAKEGQTMKKANLVGISTTTIFYMLRGCVGYAAFGKEAPGNLLTGFESYKMFWLVDLANACVVIHLLGAFQVFCQPLFAFIEASISTPFPKAILIHKVYKIRTPTRVLCQFQPFHMLGRTTFIFLVTLVAMLMPFFNDILGIVGALSFWPLTIYFPIQMHISRSKIQMLSPRWFFSKVSLSHASLCL